MNLLLSTRFEKCCQVLCKRRACGDGGVWINGVQRVTISLCRRHWGLLYDKPQKVFAPVTVSYSSKAHIETIRRRLAR